MMPTLRLHEEYELVKMPGCPEIGAILHTISVDHIDYGILYLPLAAGYFPYQASVERELGRALPAHTYEIKFALKRDFEAGVPDYTVPRDWPDLGALSYLQMMTLGHGILQSTWMLRRTREVGGFVAVAVEERPKLASYYGRLLRKYKGQLVFSVYPVLCGAGYALI